MSAPQNDGEPAFPVPVGEREFWDREENGSPNGMSLRDYFAAAALPSMMASWERWKSIENDRATSSQELAELVAVDCYEQADAMLAARKEGA
jgi:hypothetical protein